MSLSETDRLDILELLARADNAATQRDVEAYVSLFTDDVVLDGAKGEHRGKERLRQSVGPIWASEGTASVHLTLNAVVEPVAGRPDWAVATSMLLILANESPVTIYNVSAITQRLVKVDAGWQIAHRTVT